MVGDRRDQRFGVIVAGIAKDLVGLAILDQTSVAHHGNMVAYLTDHGEVMADKDGCQAQKSPVELALFARAHRIDNRLRSAWPRTDGGQASLSQMTLRGTPPKNAKAPSRRRHAFACRHRIVGIRHQLLHASRG